MFHLLARPQNLCSPCTKDEIHYVTDMTVEQVVLLFLLCFVKFPVSDYPLANKKPLSEKEKG
ncbi:hypothetical protein PL9631_710048 [Planktothrix paucivesiculata PCC 9631]|uniref:Uncharacterized protein n=1 Tax=Planktothrix paucivesiculata PCC 9631 TaxID=671071 RepID=A0A7Z9E4V5_9CYAN|nr:hypothetical protein PL9631_710048 [Planktothrix paucivesiculata PCC 9631]